MLSVSLIALLLWKAPVSEAISDLSSLTLWGISSIVGLTFLCALIASFRWKRVLHYGGARQPLSMLLIDTLVSATYNMLLPTQLGGDVIRALRCAKRLDGAKKAHLAWSSVLFERLVGVLSMALVAGVGLLFVPVSLRWIGWVVASVIGAAVIVLMFASVPFGFFASLLVTRAPSVAGVGQGISSDLKHCLAGSRVRLETTVWSVIYQLTGLLILVCTALDWGQPTALWAIIAGVPVISILTLVPVSVGGLGVRESLFVVVLGQLGVSERLALGLALVWLASSLLLALAGGGVMVLQTLGCKVGERLGN